MVTTFSRTFPGYHPRKGEPTYFVEKILNKTMPDWWRNPDKYFELLLKLNEDKLRTGKLTERMLIDFRFSLNKGMRDEKLHTIRGGHKWNKGDWFSPRVWSGRPYFDPQIIFATPMEIKKVWAFEIKVNPGISEAFYLNGTLVSESNNYMKQWFNAGLIKEIAKNDGLDLSDFLNWFKYPQPFSGQIICFSNDIKY